MSDCKYILVASDNNGPINFENIKEVTEFINMHNFEWFFCYEVVKEIKFEKFYKPVENANG